MKQNVKQLLDVCRTMHHLLAPPLNRNRFYSQRRFLKLSAPALTIGYGPIEDYGFHALDAHQCMIERRRDSETGFMKLKLKWQLAKMFSRPSALASGQASYLPPLEAPWRGIRSTLQTGTR